MSELNEQTFRHLCKDVKEIKAALLGTEFGQSGLVKRVEDVEEKVETLTNFKRKIIYYAAGAAGGGSVLVQIITGAI